jgi:hypothetical protein
MGNYIKNGEIRMAQPQLQQGALSASAEWERMKQAARQSDHDPFLETETDRAIYAIGVATGQLDPTKSVLEQQTTTVDLTGFGTCTTTASGQQLRLSAPS